MTGITTGITAGITTGITGTSYESIKVYMEMQSCQYLDYFMIVTDNTSLTENLWLYYILARFDEDR